MKSLIFILIIINFLYQLSSLLANKIQYCPNESQFNIYAADNLRDGTIRLYNGLDYVDLLLFWSNSLTSHLVNSWFVAIDNRTQLVSIVQAKGSIYGLYRNIPSSVMFVDSWESHVTVFSLLDHINKEFTFIVISQRSHEHRHSLFGRFLCIDSQQGILMKDIPLQDQVPIVKNHSKDEIYPNLFIRMSSAYRVFIDGQQYLFTIVNNRLFWAMIEIKSFAAIINNLNMDIQMTDDSKQQFHRGRIPSMTAAFIIQPTGNQIITVIIKCRKYCLVPWVAMKDNRSYFDFNPCSDSSNWNDIHNLMMSPSHLLQNHNLTIFRNFYVSEQREVDSKVKIFLQIWIINTLIQKIRSTIHQTFQEIFLTKDNFRFAFTITIFIILGVISGYLLYDHHSKKNYNVAQTEIREEQRRSLKQTIHPTIYEHEQMSNRFQARESLISIGHEISLIGLNK